MTEKQSALLWILGSLAMGIAIGFFGGLVFMMRLKP